MFPRCKTLRRSRLVFVSFALCGLVFAYGKIIHVSPDEELWAVINPTGSGSEDRIEVKEPKRGTLASRDHSSPDGQHGRSILHADWTPDSQFFIYSTASSGGHSAWHFNTFAYVRRTNKIYQLDDIIGPLVDPMFDVSSPNRFHSKRLNPDGGVDAEPIELRVELSKLAWPD
jgi:hypothetical protein